MKIDLQAFRQLSPHLEAYVSDRARRLTLRLDPQRRRVNLVIPKRYSLIKAYDFARTHLVWIEEKVGTLPQPVPFIDGTVLPVLGHDRMIAVSSDQDFKTTRIELRDREIFIRTNKDDVSARLTRFLKKEAQTAFLALSREKAERIGKKVKSLSIRESRSRWGSCASDGSMSLSWRLIFAPDYAYDYVVAHEVAHLVHQNHARPFWDLCTELSTDFSRGYDWMKKNGHDLMRYGVPAPLIDADLM